MRAQERDDGVGVQESAQPRRIQQAAAASRATISDFGSNDMSVHIYMTYGIYSGRTERLYKWVFCFQVFPGAREGGRDKPAVSQPRLE